MGGAPSGYVKTFAGSGKGTILPTSKKDAKYYADGTCGEAMFFLPSGIARHRDAKHGELLLVADSGNRIRRIEMGSRDVGTFAGCGDAGGADGPALEAEFNNPTGVCDEPSTQSVIISDHHRIRRVKGGVVTLLAGGSAGGAAKDGVGSAAVFHEPTGMVATTTGGKIYVCDSRNHRIRLVDSKTGGVTTVCGTGEDRNADGPALNGACLWNPKYIAFDTASAKPESVAYISCADAIRRWDILSGEVTTLKCLVDVPEVGLEPINPYGLAVTPSGVIIVGCRKTAALYSVDPASGKTELFVASGKHCHSADGMEDEKARFDDVGGLTIDPNTEMLYVCADKRIRRINLNPAWFKGGKSKDCRMCA